MPPSKVQKTERTHEENQERAYIAASRRSDRSLEARVESARRASEIHKKRTGRALKVTEQDVLNEEMYEEEEDDVPYAYRRLLGSQLQTGSPEFNRKLSSYLTSNLAMRTALEQSIANSYQLQNGGSVPYNYNPQLMFPSPMNHHQNQTPMMAPQHQQPSQNLHSPPAIYRHAPYPQPSAPYQTQNQHNRSASFAISQDRTGSHSKSPATPVDQRRMSLPAAAIIPGQGVAQSPSTPTTESQVNTRPHSKQRPSFSQGSFAQLNMQHTQQPHLSAQQLYPMYGNMGANLGAVDFGSAGNIYPLTTQPSAEAQMFLGPHFNYNANMTQNTTMMMSDDKFAQQSLFDFSSFQVSQDDETPAKTESQFTSLEQIHPQTDSILPEHQNDQFFNEAMERSGVVTPSVSPGVNGDTWESFIDYPLPTSSQ